MLLMKCSCCEVMLNFLLVDQILCPVLVAHMLSIAAL